MPESSVLSGAADTVVGTFLNGSTHVERIADDYMGGEVLAQQAGAGAVLTFTFSADVYLVVVESFGDTLVSRADPFGGTPTVTLGIPCRHEVPTYVPVKTAAVKVFAPVGTTVNVWGYRR